MDILVNNAGIGWPVPFGEVTEETYARFFAVNARAPFFVTQLGLSRLRDGGVSSTSPAGWPARP